MKYNFIVNNEDKSPLLKRCKHLKVIRNTYYHWLRFKNVMVLETPKMKLTFPIANKETLPVDNEVKNGLLTLGISALIPIRINQHRELIALTKKL
jgi:hypothetical protein